MHIANFSVAPNNVFKASGDLSPSFRLQKDTDVLSIKAVVISSIIETQPLLYPCPKMMIAGACLAPFHAKTQW